MSEVYLLTLGEAFLLANEKSEEFFDMAYGVPVAVFFSRNDALEFVNQLGQALERLEAGEDYQAVVEEIGLLLSRANAQLGIVVLLGSNIKTSRFSLLKCEDGKLTFETLESDKEQYPLRQDAMLA